MDYRISVIGQSGVVDPKTLELAEEVGKEIAKHKAQTWTGGGNGVMEAASKGAKEAGGLVVGMLPGDRLSEANAYIDIPVTTGYWYDYRSINLIHSCDATIMVGGGIGTLFEVTAAYMAHKPIVVLDGSGGWASRMKEIVYEGDFLDHRRESYPETVSFAASPREAVEMAVKLAEESRKRDLSNRSEGDKPKTEGLL